MSVPVYCIVYQCWKLTKFPLCCTKNIVVHVIKVTCNGDFLLSSSESSPSRRQRHGQVVNLPFKRNNRHALVHPPSRTPHPCLNDPLTRTPPIQHPSTFPAFLLFLSATSAQGLTDAQIEPVKQRLQEGATHSSIHPPVCLFRRNSPPPSSSFAVVIRVLSLSATCDSCGGASVHPSDLKFVRFYTDSELYLRRHFVMYVMYWQCIFWGNVTVSKQLYRYQYPALRTIRFVICNSAHLMVHPFGETTSGTHVNRRRDCLRVRTSHCPVRIDSIPQ